MVLNLQQPECEVNFAEQAQMLIRNNQCQWCSYCYLGTTEPNDCSCLLEQGF